MKRLPNPERIITALIGAGISETKIARKIGMTQSGVNRLRNRKHDIKFANYKKLYNLYILKIRKEEIFDTPADSGDQ